MIRYCELCGSQVTYVVPAGDSLPRHVCQECGHIHYQNPKLVVGCVAEWEGRILLCKRAIEPRLGFWTLPAGFMENGETTAQAARRETLEEACAKVTLEGAFAMLSIPQISQVHLFYRATLHDGKHAAGDESLETRLFDAEDIPWEQLAFPSITRCLRLYFGDRTEGEFRFHEEELQRE